MTKPQAPIRLAALALLLASACASAGRTAVWERSTVAAAPAAQDAQSEEELDTLLANARAHFDKRDDRAELEKAIELWERVVAHHPTHAEALTMLSRAYFFLVDGHYANDKQKPVNFDQLRLELHQKGADYGERALVALDPAFEQTMRAGGEFTNAIAKIEKPAVPAAYWYCANLGRFATAKGLSAKLYYKDRLRTAMERIAELDPDYFYGAADRYLGAYYAALPGIAGKDLDRSKQHFEAAQQKGPTYVGNKVIAAEFLAVERDDKALFRKLLEEALAAPDTEDPDIAPENRAAKKAAKRMLEPDYIEDKF